MSVILASKSPRRIELLSRFGIKAESIPADIDETLPASIRTPAEAVEYLSRRKAEAVFRKVPDGSVVIAADTLVFIGDETLGKPKDKADAVRMMRLLSGKTHRVVTGMTVLSEDQTVCESVATDVLFRTLPEREIDAYTDTDEPYDKAGGYGIQSLGGAFVREIHGDYYNVVGLPIARLLEILGESFGIRIFG